MTIRTKLLDLISRMPEGYLIARRFESPMFRPRHQEYRHQYPCDQGKFAVVGLPKSGNNWLMYLICDCLDISYTSLFGKNGGVGIGITHAPISHSVLYNSEFIRGVYILRDIRDVIVSYYKYAQTDDYRQHNNPGAFYDSFESFYYGYFLSTVIHRYDWTEHPDTYARRGIPLVRYERLIDAPVEEISGLFRCWNIEVSQEKILFAIENNAISKLQKEGKTTIRKIPTTHFRKGGYGNYKTEMPDNICADVEDRFGAYLRRWGYPVIDDLQG